jgi:hypothetical protein
VKFPIPTMVKHTHSFTRTFARKSLIVGECVRKVGMD